MIPLPVRLAAVFVVGACLGSFVNWAIYTLAWRPRPVSPWCPTGPGVLPRRRSDRVPILGWLGLRREADQHGRGFWIRPLLLEVTLGVALAALYWWEVAELGLIQRQIGARILPPWGPLHWQFASHALLLCWMLAASFIDIDEKIIPDEITVTGTLLGLVLATLVPMSLLPQVVERAAAPVVGRPIQNLAGGPVLGPDGLPLWLEPMTPVAPNVWPAGWADVRAWQSLLLAILCYLLWCFALAPRIWRGRRGVRYALQLIAARVWREYRRPPLAAIVNVGVAAICVAWVPIGAAGRTGLVTAMVGLVASGGLVWAVRLIGTAALRREAMGFGDVTLMMMVGTFLGWQACLIAFFLAPFAALLIGVAQFILRRDDVIPYGPFLCLASAGVVVAWAPIWMWAQPLFAQGPLVPIVLFICLVLLGLMLAVWQMIKTALFGRSTDNVLR
jgi:prepilin signal peptidase PulO-like enzyme (type II secretory pathway)